MSTFPENRSKRNILRSSVSKEVYIVVINESLFYNVIIKFIKLYFMVTISSYIVLLIGALGFTLTLYLGLLKGVKLI